MNSLQVQDEVKFRSITVFQKEFEIAHICKRSSNSSQLIEYGQIELVPAWSLHPCVLVSSVWEGAL